ncbi:hypothetical protein [Hymenobacter jeollabukensis]|uniref:Uncharacterized protein n=1 Tax=Hymenobacter jeollabukensis TaxID=2025313 RepID=A0A5R8WIM7_9BACT|nr:hypothetical protein [Hymenobacter jeollabukensis]TLM88718.1 hypothetical protein FDY95_23060 [Hymenobacter jeollabukensis]
MYNFRCLTTKDWVKDYGFGKALEADPGTRTFAGQVLGPGRKDVVAYWQAEKSDYPLWQLLLHMGAHTVPQTVAYFDLPADTVPFLSWVYNHVAHEQREQVQGMAQGFFGAGFDQMNFYPYPQLYQVWQRESDAQRSARAGNVKVYLDRLTEPDGQELLRFAAPTLFE